MYLTRPLLHVLLLVAETMDISLTLLMDSLTKLISISSILLLNFLNYASYFMIFREYLIICFVS